MKCIGKSLSMPLLIAAVVTAIAEPPAEGPDSFSFTIDGAHSSSVLSTWKRVADSLEPPTEPGRWPLRYATNVADLERADFLTYSGQSLSLTAQREVFAEGYAYVQFLSFANNSTSDSPVFGDIYPIDIVVPLNGDGPITLHYAKGSHSKQTDFQPMETVLEQAKPIAFAPYGGRSSDGFLPYFNVVSSNDGVVIAIGWTGQWTTTFEAIDAHRVRVRAGMDRVRARLRANESMRTPAVLVLNWSGKDWLSGQNDLRRLMLRHFTPQQNGVPVSAPIAASPHSYIGFNEVTEANLRDCVERIASHKLPVDTFWLDAGWGLGGFPRGMGNPDPDPSRFPNGLRPIGDTAHARGFKYLQWFEPERVMMGTWLEQNHPEWLLSPVGLPPKLAYHEKDGFKLLNLGNDDARTWIAKKISSQIADYRIDIYRQDFNMYPLYYWRNNESYDRIGMSEVKYIEGLYAFLDTLRADHPNLVIDNCASGGRRLDFEMMRRSLALWRSDNCWKPIAEQCMTYGLSLWLPVHGVGSISLGPYEFRSGMGSSFTMALDFRSDDPKFWEDATARVNELMRVREFFSKDYYPLTPYTTADDAWIAWQFHDPEKNAGVVQAFRREKSTDSVRTVTLRGLDTYSSYSLMDLDSSTATIASGASLSDSGTRISIAQSPGSALLIYSRVSD